MRNIRFHLFRCVIVTLIWNKNVLSLTTRSGMGRRIYSATRNSPLFISVGIGPKEPVKEIIEEENLIEDHEKYRKSRLTAADTRCDEWFQSLLGDEDIPNRFVLGDVAKKTMEKIMTLCKLEQDPITKYGDKDYTIYRERVLPTSPILPAFGLETYGIPVPRRNAEAWRHFDIAGMINTDYSLDPDGRGYNLILTDEEMRNYESQLRSKGFWMDDDSCEARLIYINGQFCPALSKTTDFISNLDLNDFIKSNGTRDEVLECLERLTDGFTDELPQEEGQASIESIAGEKLISRLSGVDHCVGKATSQFAINNQQGTAIFSALNTCKTGAVALVDIPPNYKSLPVMIVNAQTANGGVVNDEESKGVAHHPRTLVIAGKSSDVPIIQGAVDLDQEHIKTVNRPKLYNGYTQMFIRNLANVSHTYLEESGGSPTPDVEFRKQDLPEGSVIPQDIEANRPELKNSYLESIDIYLTGEKANYKGTVISVGGNGRSRICLSSYLLQPRTHTELHGFSLAGGAQRCDMRTNIHHVAPMATSCQVQKNFVAGRATTTFKGRIRVEQEAQLTEADQITRTILLSDACTIWAIPSLEIIADDVKCTHGSTVSDLSEEEMFYLRSRGFNAKMARNMLMFAFINGVSREVHPSIRFENTDYALDERLSSKLKRLVPKGDRATQGEFQSV